MVLKDLVDSFLDVDNFLVEVDVRNSLDMYRKIGLLK